MNFDVIVVGGGPAGMMAATVASQQGKRVLLLEKNRQLGKKLLITGKGRCNITNNADIGDFIEQVPMNSSFLYSAFYSFTNQQLLDLLHQQGLETKVERGGRVFPVSDRSSDVLHALVRLMGKGVEVSYQSPVQSLWIEEGRLRGVMLKNGERKEGARVVVATGGASYPATGSTGDGYQLAKQAGHRVIPPRPSLVPLETQETWPGELSGLGLKNIGITVRNPQGKVVYEDFGELLFTHFGVSGPVVLSASAHIRQVEGHVLQIDLKPALQMEQLDARLLRDFEKYSRKDLLHAMEDLLPKKLIPVVLQVAELDPHSKTHQITKEQRRRLGETLKELSLHITATRPLAEAIITSGGVCVEEINPSTMESKCLPGLYFCGEVLDVDAYTGGYNLQIAFSTGYLAGK